MATVVFLHAHPDDECLTTGGTMARLAAEGHRVVLVTATDGALGEVPEGLLADGEALAARRATEVKASGQVLGAAAVHLLGYPDSGMVGTEGNAAPGAFCNVDVDEAASTLCRVLREEGADLLVTYDENGGYGHPDHIQVHRVGMRAADLAGIRSLYEATINRDEMLRLLEQAVQDGLMSWPEEGAPTPVDLNTIGLPPSEITTTIDVGDFVPAKLAAMRCHETQIGDMGMFFEISDESFRQVFGCEYFVRIWAPAGTPDDHLV